MLTKKEVISVLVATFGVYTIGYIFGWKAESDFNSRMKLERRTFKLESRIEKLEALESKKSDEEQESA